MIFTPPPPVPAVASAAPAGVAVGIYLSEWEVGVGRPKVTVGKVRFNITNYGEDPHDFAVRTAAGKVLKRAPEISSGGTNTTPFTFKSKGTYTLVCTLSGHEELGMKSSIKVTKKPKRR